jgi:hypothetical protein
MFATTKEDPEFYTKIPIAFKMIILKNMVSNFSAMTL